MRKDITIAAEPRDSRGKNEARRLRVAGRIPAVVYGTGGDSIPLALSPKELHRILHSSSGHNTIFNLDLAGRENTPVMVVDWQMDPITDRLLHADLKRIDLNKALLVKIPVHTIGDSKGVKQQGGLLELITREIEVECLPDDIPEHLTVDVSELMLNQNIRARDVALSGSMRLVSPPESVICHVITVRVEEKPAEEEAVVAPVAATTAEPEVIKKGKKEEEGAVAGKDEKKKKK